MMSWYLEEGSGVAVGLHTMPGTSPKASPSQEGLIQLNKAAATAIAVAAIAAFAVTGTAATTTVAVDGGGGGAATAAAGPAQEHSVGGFP